MANKRVKWGEGMIANDFKRQKAENMVEELYKDEELLNHFNSCMRKHKLTKIKEKKNV